MHFRAIEIRDVKIGLSSNNEKLIGDPEYFEKIVPQSLLTDYYQVKEIPYSADLDAHVTLIDEKGIRTKVLHSDRELVARADFTNLEGSCKDKRYAFLGTQGMLYRFILWVLETQKGVYSFHSASLFDPFQKRFLLILGGPNSGKTPVLLAGVQKGYQVFGTELTHLKEEPNGYSFFRGGVIDNIRPGHMIKHFPAVLQKLGMKLEQGGHDLWNIKIAVDFRSFEFPEDSVKNPLVEIILPKIEEGGESPVVNEVKLEKDIVKILFENASEKIGATTLMYDQFPIAGFDNQKQAERRFAAMQSLVHKMRPRRVWSFIAASGQCVNLI
jgi:hypothetical protein